MNNTNNNMNNNNATNNNPNYRRPNRGGKMPMGGNFHPSQATNSSQGGAGTQGMSSSQQSQFYNNKNGAFHTQNTPNYSQQEMISQGFSQNLLTQGPLSQGFLSQQGLSQAGLSQAEFSQVNQAVSPLARRAVCWVFGAVR
jgi:hypothetical protein